MESTGFSQKNASRFYAAVPQLFLLPFMRQCRIFWAMEIFTTRTYERAVRKLTSAGARRETETAIAADPKAVERALAE